MNHGCTTTTQRANVYQRNAGTRTRRHPRSSKFYPPLEKVCSKSVIHIEFLKHGKAVVTLQKLGSRLSVRALGKKMQYCSTTTLDRTRVDRLKML
ncbi:hypothetical protein PoB_000801100 [Plakobranchus ocellatus]|uniref:Uncharacterized protein n=1 Tax=Plakobranchus ocellatus TaxID=259542 RepID=A0AAV3YGL5_9GAST|nr:hypothetical protein PoB_000801100 [Plakobranchus ocellatus]